MLSEGSRTREAPPLPLGHVRAIEKAVELRAEENLSYAAIAVVMRRYHGLRRTPEWWLRQCRAAGAAPKYHGSQVYLRRGALFKIDEAVLAALSECPLTILQLRYKLGGNFDKLDRSLGRLIEAGRIVSDGTGLERRWRPR